VFRHLQYDDPAPRNELRLKGDGAMLRVRCPECGVEGEIAAQHGDEVVSVYCLNHTGGADAHTRPVCITLFRTAMRVTEPEPAAA